MPHQTESGKCYTYDPDFDSHPSKWYAVKFGISYGRLNSTKDKEEMLANLKIFIHDRGMFHFYTQDDMPSSIKLENSRFMFKRETSIDFSLSKVKRLSTKEFACKDGPGNPFFDCFIRWSYTSYGQCQAPWDGFHRTSTLILAMYLT